MVILRYKVFLDSNVYDGANYSFRNSLFTALKNRAQAGNLELQSKLSNAYHLSEIHTESAKLSTRSGLAENGATD